MVRSVWLRATLAVIIVAGATLPPRAAESDDDASRFRNLRYLCTQTGINRTEAALLGCDDIRDEPDLVRAGIHARVENVCRSISSSCVTITNHATMARYSNYSTMLSCTRYGYECGGGDRQLKAACDRGNINPVVAIINQIERAGGRVPNALRRAVRAYVEICAVNRDVGTAMTNVTAELTGFYNKKYLGCEEAGFEGTVNECTAAIDRQWQYFSAKGVLDWTSSNSVVSQVSIAAVRRWTGLEERPRRGR